MDKLSKQQIAGKDDRKTNWLKTNIEKITRIAKKYAIPATFTLTLATGIAGCSYSYDIRENNIEPPFTDSMRTVIIKAVKEYNQSLVKCTEQEITWGIADSIQSTWKLPDDQKLIELSERNKNLYAYKFALEERLVSFARERFGDKDYFFSAGARSYTDVKGCLPSKPNISEHGSIDYSINNK